MAQFARPTLDKVRINWFDETASIIVNLFSRVDESSASDADYITSSLSPSNAVMVFQLSYLDDPVSSINHIVRYRFRKDQDLGDTISLTVQLIQGYINEGTIGTVISSKVENPISGLAWVAGTFTLAPAEADAITNYRDLFIRIVANKV